MHVVMPGQGTSVSALGSTYTSKTDGAAVAAAYSLVEEEFWGDPTPLHRHLNEEEAFYVLSGEVAVWVDGAEVVTAPGTFLVVPRGAAHAVRRITEGPVRMLTVISPPGLQRLFDAVVERGESALLEDPEELRRLAKAYGSEILGPHPLD